MKHSIATFYINRNVDIIRQFKKLNEVDGIKVRTAVAMVAGNVGVTSSVVNAVLYADGYAYRQEAWDLYNEEIGKQEEGKGATNSVATATQDVA